MAAVAVSIEAAAAIEVFSPTKMYKDAKLTATVDDITSYNV